MKQFFGSIMTGIFTVISAILLFWHGLWEKIVGQAAFLGTNWAWILGIVFLVLTVRTVLFPVFVKQIKSQRAMQALQPKVKELQAKHKGDRETMQKELMELYRTEKANPLMGCLPMFLQIPVFFGLYHVLHHVNPDTSGPWKVLYGWSGGQFDSASRARLFGAPIAASFKSSAVDLGKFAKFGLEAPSVTNVKVVAAALVAIMIVTTFLTSRQMIKKTGWSEEPQQRMIQRLMLYGVPFSLLISGGFFPIGVIIYWVTTNLFSLGQQHWVLRKYPPPAMAKGGTGGKGTAGAAGTAGKPVPPKPGPKDTSNGAIPGIEASGWMAPKVGAKPNNPKKGGTAKKR